MSEDTSSSTGNTAPGGGLADPVDQNQPGQADSGKPAEDGQDQGKVKFKGEFDRERSERALEAARADATTEKQKRQAAEKQKNDVLKALGLDPEGKPDAKALAADLDKERTEARQARVELAVYRAAGKVGGDPDALLDSRAFLDSIADLDPTAQGFVDAVGGAIAKAIEGNPRLKAAPATGGKGGVPLTGGPDGKTTKPTSLEEALSGRV